MKLLIENIEKHLNGEMKQAAIEFCDYLKENNLTFYKDNCDCWKDKIYYWIKLGEQCVCYIAVKDPDEPNNQWTIWSEDSESYRDSSAPHNVKIIAWQNIDYCGNCKSCGGGKQKVIFGKIFNNVCGCTFRIDNAKSNELPFLKKIVEMRIADILKNGI